MPAFVIFDIDVADQDAYVKDYVPRSGASVAAHGGRFIVRGGDPQPLEGGWEPTRVVVIEFPDVDAARAWYESDDYAEAKPFRQAVSTGRGIIVAGA